MTNNMPENLEDLAPPAAEPALVDDGKVRRKSILDGALRGIKRGLMWGGLGGLVASGIGGAAALFLGKTTVTAGAGILPYVFSGLAWVGMVGGVPGKIAAGLGFGTLALFGLKTAAVATAAATAPASTAIAAIGTVAGVAIPVIGVALVAGAVIGATWGAISGYMESDSKIEQEHRKAAQVAAQLNFERQRVMKEILQQREMESQFDAQSRRLAGNSPEIGNFQAPNTPTQTGHDKGQEQNPRGWG